MYNTHGLISGRSLNQRELCAHLSVNKSSITTITTRFGLEAISGKYPWRRVLTTIHGIDAHRLPSHLQSLKRKYPSSPILNGINDLESELDTALWSFGEVSDALGVSPNTLSRSIKERRAKLPIRQIDLGPRKRMYRPLEILLWRDEGVLLKLPKTRQIQTLPKSDGATPRYLEEAPSSEVETIFGAFGANNRKPN
jgi:hypothetical protein